VLVLAKLKAKIELRVKTQKLVPLPVAKYLPTSLEKVVVSQKKSVVTRWKV
jgi:hypothetical protein